MDIDTIFLALRHKRYSLIDWQFGRNRRAAAWRRLDIYAAAEKHDAFPHTDETARSRRFQDHFGIEAATPIFNLKIQHVDCHPDAHGYTCHTRVTYGIG